MESEEYAKTTFWQRFAWIYWAAAGVCLTAYGAVLAVLSPRLTFEAQPGHGSVLLYVGARVLMGAVVVGGLLLIRHLPPSRRWIGWMLAVGAAARAALVPASPVLENDYNRYLWDGAVVASGHNPYTLPPDAGRKDWKDSGPVIEAFRKLAEEAGPVHKRINHPHLTTIYPPLAQLAFAVAHWISPWNVLGLKVVMLLFDVVTLLLLMLVFRAVGVPVIWAAVYWWNPILLNEFYIGGHMDLLALPFVAASLLWAIRGRIPGAVVWLAIGVGFKFWPILLLPLTLRPALRNPRLLALSASIFVVVAVAIFWPMVTVGDWGSSGLWNYARSWSNNAVVYPVLKWICRGGASLIGFHPGWGNFAARWVSALLVLGVALWLARKPATDAIDFFDKCVLTLAALFILSPTPFPWYFGWMLPLLALRPRLSLLLYTVLLPLYQIKYRWPALVWVEHLPVIALLAWELSRLGRSDYFVDDPGPPAKGG